MCTASMIRKLLVVAMAALAATPPSAASWASHAADLRTQSIPVSTGWMDIHEAAKLAFQDARAKPVVAETWTLPGIKSAVFGTPAELAAEALAAAKAAAIANGTLTAGATAASLETAVGVAAAEVEFYASPKTLVARAPPSGPFDGSSLPSPGPVARSYANMRLRYRNTRYNSVRPGPAAFYMPEDARGLAKTIKSLNAAGTPWVVRSGGHSYETNALPSSPAAAVIDMSRFGALKVDPVARTVTFGAGQRLGNIYRALAAHDPPLTMVAGTCPANGASGFLNGGGVGLFVRGKGWGSDWLVSARTVTAEGEPLDATPHGADPRSRDALWALRGGGAGTAVVHEMTVAVVPAPARVSVCTQVFAASGPADTAAFVRALFREWAPATSLDGAAFPSARFYFAPDFSAAQLTGWDLPADRVGAELAAGMAGAAGAAVAPPACRQFDDWTSYLVYFGIEVYYGAEAAATATPANFSVPHQLSADYLGWPFGGRAAPLSPFAPFAAANPTLLGPSPFEAQGVFSYAPWTDTTAAAVWAAQAAGLYFGGYTLGGASAGLAGPAASDGVGAAFSARAPAVALLDTDVTLPDPAGVAAAEALAAAVDATTGAAGQPSRFYNFLNCYRNATSDQLYSMYYGPAVAPRLKAIKAALDPAGRLTPWCDV